MIAQLSACNTLEFHPVIGSEIAGRKFRPSTFSGRRDRAMLSIVPTIAEIANRAEVPLESVLRYLNEDSVGDAAVDRIKEAIDELGPPHGTLAPFDVLETERIRGDIAVRMQDAVRSDVEIVPNEVGQVVFEALRVEVKPVAEHIERLQALVQNLTRELVDINEQLRREQNARVEDLALLTDLIVSGWTTASRRLARLEAHADQNGSVTPRLQL